MCHEYYAKIINAIEENIIVTDLLDKVLFAISSELQNYLNDNITTFHHTISDCVKIEHIDNKISFRICEQIYTINKNVVLKEYYTNFYARPNCSSENIMKDCLLKELLYVITNI